MYTTIVHKNSNTFQILENNDLIVTGKVLEINNTNAELRSSNALIAEEPDDLPLMKDDIYQEFLLRGHNYGGQFQGITYINGKGM